MAGIYFHIPFCKSKCNYCDFYSVTTSNISDINLVVQSFKSELKDRSIFFKNETIETIYFGGGTPSLLSAENIEELLKKCYELGKVIQHPEITIEANPDDINPQYINELISAGINRISIGCQSFSDKQLAFMNRRHNANQALKAIDICLQSGLKNISIDLIYGLPKMTNIEWKDTLQIALNKNIKHLSVYHLTYHENTPLWNDYKTGKIIPITDDKSIEQFQILVDLSEKAGFLQYEISNFCKKGYHSKHNSSYWKNISYLGIGPSAHSYYNNKRYWNISSVKKYIDALNNKQVYFEEEYLNQNKQYNEYIITSLRTIWGVDPNKIKDHFNDYYSEFEKVIKKYIKSGNLKYNDNKHIVLTDNGIMISDTIMSDLMIIKF